jgi:uncharacterized membrane protein YagU involved in acid resistance
MNKTRTIIIAGIIAGTLDAVAAILLYAKPPELHNISRIFRHIASGLFGKQAYLTGPFYPFTGLVLHYLIAIIWSAVYFLVLFPVFRPGSVWVKTILFGCLIWIIMNGFVLPLIGLTARYDGWGVLRSFTIILLCVALPISILVEKKLGNIKI